MSESESLNFYLIKLCATALYFTKKKLHSAALENVCKGVMNKTKYNEIQKNFKAA